ncbi:hypothetical protein PISMIDRAFT_110269, partial [Pisolithus microcarpus 441]
MANPVQANQLATQEVVSSSLSTCGCGCGHAYAPVTPVERIPKIQWDDKDPNIHAHTARLISWCKMYPDTRIKLFSDSHQEVVNEGWRCQQMSAQKEVYFQQPTDYISRTDAVFTHDHDPHIQQLYAQYLSVFVKPIKSCFQLLRKKYNDANKTLSSSGAGLTAIELRERPEMKRLLDKILDTFPWWEDPHGFWRTNLSYNTVCSTGDPSQDFTAEAQQYF